VRRHSEALKADNITKRMRSPARQSVARISEEMGHSHLHTLGLAQGLGLGGQGRVPSKSISKVAKAEIS
jgi:hypothetical protein